MTDSSEKVIKTTCASHNGLRGKKPICVGACPTRALDAGSIQDLKSKYGLNREVKGFSYSQDLGPSVLFKSK